MRTHIRAAAAAGVCAVVFGLAACSGDDDPEATGDPTASEAVVEDDGTSDDIDPRLSAIVGTWKFDSGMGYFKELVIAADGTAVYSEEGDSGGPYTGTITLGAQNPHVFTGEGADGSSIEISFDRTHDDKLTLDEDFDFQLERVE
jgi:hypothetical protein